MRPDSQFICPECGSQESRGLIFVDYGKPTDDPWTDVLQVMICANCKAGIPAHLGERWDGISLEAAQKEWREVYRANQPKWD